MVRFVEITTKIDKQGRILIPIEFRKKLGLEDETIVNVHLIDKRIFIEVINPELEQAVKKWRKNLSNKKIQPFVLSKEDLEPQTKWFSEEYVRQKLGL